MTNWTMLSAVSTDALDGKWGAWFGDYATAAAAKRYLTMNFTGPKVSDHAEFPAWEIRQVDGRWQVRLFVLNYHPEPLETS